MIITREEAMRQVDILVAERSGCELLHYGRTIVALYDEAKGLRTDLRLAQNSEVARMGELTEKDDQIASLTTRLGLVRAELDAARAEIATLTASLRLAEASVSLLRADLEETQRQRDNYLEQAVAARMELARLRAAEAPGTDDDAFDGTGWAWNATWREWRHTSGACVGRCYEGSERFWKPVDADWSQRCVQAIDAMRAAVPGSV